MPELALLEPTVLTGLIQKFVAPPENVAQGMFPTRPYPQTIAEWDVVSGNRQRATPGMPNREGKLVGQGGVGKKTSTFIYVREKKAFEPTTLRWLREPGTLATNNAEAAIRREAVDLDNRLSRLIESYCWEAMKGSIVIDEPDVKATVDYGFTGTHLPTAGTLWSDTSTADILANLRAWKLLIQQDSGFVATEIYLNSVVMEYVLKNEDIREMIGFSTFMQQYLDTGTMKGLMGLNWHVFDGAYVDVGGNLVKYLPDTHVLLMANAPGSKYILEGLSADESAPRNFTGKYAKTWTTEDPSGRFMILEYNFIPVVENVDTLVYAEVSGS